MAERPDINAWNVMIPRLSFCRWGGCDVDGLHDYEGWSITVEWLGCILEIAFGRRDKRLEHKKMAVEQP